MIYIGLGTNLGNRDENLALARKLISEQVALVLIESSIYQTEPWGKTDQPYFLNQVVGIESSLPPDELLKSIQNIESQMGRERKEKWGARIIDLDILFYDDQIIHTENLTIPHPFIADREFVLAPMAEIAPDMIHPETKKSISEMLASVRTTPPKIAL